MAKKQYNILDIILEIKKDFLKYNTSFDHVEIEGVIFKEIDSQIFIYVDPDDLPNIISWGSNSWQTTSKFIFDLDNIDD